MAPYTGNWIAALTCLIAAAVNWRAYVISRRRMNARAGVTFLVVAVVASGIALFRL
jgi:hypothetical protein